jgi:type I restriction enzyme, R subunit
MKPEEQARQKIDDLLEQAGWIVQDRRRLNLSAGYGVAVREFSTAKGPADYLLFVKREAVGIVEAKKVGETLTGVEEQSNKYRRGIPEDLPAARLPLPFAYETTGVETRFTSYLDPVPRSRPVFAFHRPETLAAWLAQAPEELPNEQNNALRARMLRLPSLATKPLRDCQIEAITNLELSFAENRPRALIQMATGSGKTYMTVSSIYRLIKFAGAKRVLFLVDRANLGRQTLKEFQQYETPDDGRKFTELYNVQHLQSNVVDDASRVCITTIQRLYSLLRGEELKPEEEELSLFESRDENESLREVQYNPQVPIETFDIIFTDECHRSIYNKWRGVLEYFDSFIVGLTATPNKQTFGFFNRNLVMEYGHERAVADGVNVDYLVYRIRTDISERGSTIEALSHVGKRERLTRAVRWDQLDEDLTYAAKDVDRYVEARDQIRTVMREYRATLKTVLFPHRRDVPKNLIFAKDDSHAETIVQIVREEFALGNEFAQKITYKTTGVKPEDLIASFRNSYYPRIAVTVDMIATGTDIKPLEVLLFMCSVRSRGLFEQMKGRGSRVIDDAELQAVTNAPEGKQHFVIVDATGVCEDIKTDNPPLERQASVPLKKVLENVALGKWRRDADLLPTLAGRLARLSRHTTPAQEASIRCISGHTLHELAADIVSALDPDRQFDLARQESGDEYLKPDDPAVKAVARRLIAEAAAPFDDPDLRDTLIKMQQRDEMLIDETSQDSVIESGWDIQAEEKARQTVASFRLFIEQHRDEITALEIFYQRPYHARLRLKDVKELAEAIKSPPLGLSTDALWQAYETLEKTRVRKGKNTKRMLTDIVSLIRYTIERDTDTEAVLEPYSEIVAHKFAAWLEEQERLRGKPFTHEQRQWLEMIRDTIATSMTIEPEDFEASPFDRRGGPRKAYELFGAELLKILQDLNERLAA